MESLLKFLQEVKDHVPWRSELEGHGAQTLLKDGEAELAKLLGIESNVISSAPEDAQIAPPAAVKAEAIDYDRLSSEIAAKIIAAGSKPEDIAPPVAPPPAPEGAAVAPAGWEPPEVAEVAGSGVTENEVANGTAADLLTNPPPPTEAPAAP